jgi:hypothetical protein
MLLLLDSCAPFLLLAFYPADWGRQKGGKAFTKAHSTRVQGMMVKGILPQIEKRVEQLFKGKPLLSYDNATIHTKAESILREAGVFISCPHWVSPPQSADLQKVVEHAHGRIGQRWQEELQKDGQQVFTAQQYISWLKEIFKKVTRPETVAADVRSLYSTYQAVIAAKGDWPEKKSR